MCIISCNMLQSYRSISDHVPGAWKELSPWNRLHLYTESLTILRLSSAPRRRGASMLTWCYVTSWPSGSGWNWNENSLQANFFSFQQGGDLSPWFRRFCWSSWCRVVAACASVIKRFVNWKRWCSQRCQSQSGSATSPDQNLQFFLWWEPTHMAPYSKNLRTSFTPVHPVPCE